MAKANVKHCHCPPKTKHSATKVHGKTTAHKKLKAARAAAKTTCKC